ncbi:MAG: hypothetical protein EOM83_17315 [Clostridia bacterium]|nr:hypothetical protein [Clostridia bacterium]
MKTLNEKLATCWEKIEQWCVNEFANASYDIYLFYRNHGVYHTVDIYFNKKDGKLRLANLSHGVTKGFRDNTLATGLMATNGFMQMQNRTDQLECSLFTAKKLKTSMNNPFITNVVKPFVENWQTYKAKALEELEKDKALDDFQA